MAAIVGGIFAIRHTPLEALPDLSDAQVIVQADYNEQAPRIVEDQVTYPIAAEMLKVPGARTVRGYSFFGVSFVYVIFADGTDLYWARSRVLENLNGIKGKLPPSVTPTLGPDATGLGWVYQYALEDTTGRSSTWPRCAALQDWYLRYALTAVPGVAEVASVGGFEKQYQVDIDPARLLAYGISVTRVMNAIQSANNDVGAMTMELSEREYMVRGLGYLEVDRRHRERRRRRDGERHADPRRRTGARQRRAGEPARRGGSRRARRRGGRDRRHALRPERAGDDRRGEGKARRGRSADCRRAWWCGRCTTAAT